MNAQGTQTFIAWHRLRRSFTRVSIGVYASFEDAQKAAINALKDQLIDEGYSYDEMEKSANSGFGFKQGEDWGAEPSTDHINQLMRQQAEEIARLQERLAYAIEWTVEDFETQAQERENMLGEELYDRSKFKEAHNRMMHAHDGSVGISWDTVDFWLNEVCK